MSQLIATPERRAWPRMLATQGSGLALTRVRAGRVARVLDVCPGGVQVETEWRLLPGSRVLQLSEPMTIYTIKGNVVRCQVVMLDRERIEYRGAVAFDQPLTLDF